MEAWPQIILPYGLSPLHCRVQTTGEKFAVLPLGCKKWYTLSMKDLSQLSSINMSNSTANNMRFVTRKSSRKTPRDMQRKRKHREKEQEKENENDGVKTRAKKKRANTAPANMGDGWTVDRDQLPDSEYDDEDARMAGADQYVVPSLNQNQEH
jgi:hypothetical protein